jgi:hypothetical protein
MSKNSGYLVALKDGRIGRTYHKESKLNGKIVVTVICATESDFEEGIFLEENEQLKILCHASNLRVIGMAD